MAVDRMHRACFVPAIQGDLMPFALDRSPFRPSTLVAVALLAILTVVAGALPVSALAADPTLATASITAGSTPVGTTVRSPSA